MVGERSEPTDALDFTQEDVQAAWKDGRDYTIEEMMSEPSGMSIDEVQRARQDFANRIARIGMMIQHSLIWDHVMTPDQVSDHWRDEFLTNVIVPFLEHIKNHDATYLNDLLEGNRHALATTEIGRSVQVEAITEYAERVMALNKTVAILRDWRG